MKKLYLLSAVLVVQVFCFVAGNCSVHAKSFPEQPIFGKDIWELVENHD